MSHQENIGKAKGYRAHSAAVVAAALFFGMLFASSATASYQQLPGNAGCFAGSGLKGLEACELVAEEKFGEEVQLGGAGGMAVNRTGAGGVAKGTVYVATHALDGTRVAMFEPKGEGLKFVQRWGVSAEGTYERCGPLLGMKEVEGKEVAEVPCGPRPAGGHGWVDVEVDQESGGVFVFGGFTPDVGENEVVEYEADGSAVITRFAKKAPEGKTVAQTPAEVHFTSPELGPLAINSTGAGGVPKGTVYLADETQGTYHRVMVFEPGVGGYEYAGETAAGSGGNAMWGPVVDDAGNLYLDGQEEEILEFAAEAPAAFPAPASSPLCEYKFGPAGIIALTVDPVKGEPFFFSYKKPKRLRRLGACDEATHKFAESLEPEAIEVKPERDDLWGLAFDPGRELPGRPAGVLYGGAPNPEPGSGVGKGEPGQSALGYIFAHPEENPPTIEAEAVSRVSARGAQLEAKLDPNGHDTHYAFLYISKAQYLQEGESFAKASQAPSGGAVEKGTGARAIGAAIAGLEPQSTYLFRVVASSVCSKEKEVKKEECVSEGAVRELQTYPEGPYSLPDNRAWELVSPTDKQGGQVLPADPGISSCPFGCKPGTTYTYFPLQSSAEGDAIAYEGTPFGEEGAAIENEYLARRTSAGWQSTNPTPALLLSKGGQGYKFLSADLGTAVLEQLGPRLSPEAAPEGYPDLYTQPSGDPLGLVPLIREKPPLRTAQQFELGFAGASEDGSRIFFAANDALIEEEVAGIAPPALAVSASQSNLYEWHEGQLALVNVLPGNATASPGSFGARSAQTISADGKRAFWTSEVGQLYVRIGGSETIQVSKSQRTVEDPLGTQPVSFLGASTDGARALFSSSEELTDDANTGLGQEVILKATAGTFTLTFVAQSTTPLPFNASATEVRTALEALSSVGKGNVAVAMGKEGPVVTFTGVLATNQVAMSANGAGLTGTVTLRPFRPGKDLYQWHEGTLTDLSAGQGSWALQGIVGTGKDLTHVYFVDTAVLDGKANAEGENAEVGKFNLYGWSEVGGPRFVAQLVGGDNSGGVLGGDWVAFPAVRTAEASPGGRYLAFRSIASLTGFDNTGACSSANHPEDQAPCPEAFLYDAQSEALICASCNRSGAPPLGFTTLRRIRGTPSYLPQQRYLTDSGRLYFDSQNSLSPADSNEGAEDVYEYEPMGVGSCTEAGGCVALISAGREGEDSNFLAIDATGKNVFFTTRDRLVGADSDQLIDLYVAREGGGFDEGQPREECQGEACQPPTVIPPEPTPTTPSFSGPGNYTPPKYCKKGKVRRHGKCVKKSSRKHKQKHPKQKRGGAK